jgi:uncharacterized protein YecT (DUF1311 family)
LFPAFLVLLFSVQVISAEEGAPLPKDWQIQLQPAFELFDGVVRSAPQQTINQLTAQQTELRDMELAGIYLQLWMRLPAKDQEKLKADQAQWLITRSKRSAKAAQAEEGGSAAPMEANLAAAKITDERIIEMRKRLQAQAKAALVPGRTGAPFPKTWRIDPQPAIDWLDEDSGDGPITAICRNHETQLEIRDAQLVLAYLTLCTQLDQKQRASLKTEQIDWLAARTKKAAAAAANGYDDETLAAMRSIAASMKLTEPRIAELNQRFTKAAGAKPKR